MTACSNEEKEEIAIDLLCHYRLRRISELGLLQNEKYNDLRELHTLNTEDSNLRNNLARKTPNRKKSSNQIYPNRYQIILKGEMLIDCQQLTVTDLQEQSLEFEVAKLQTSGLQQK